MNIEEIRQAAKKLKRTRTMGNSILIARVHKKSCLSQYNTQLVVQERRRFPITFSLTLADMTGELNCQIWEGPCARFFGKIEINDVVSIHGFRVR